LAQQCGHYGYLQMQLVPLTKDEFPPSLATQAGLEKL
jgi:hypothetical protein